MAEDTDIFMNLMTDFVFKRLFGTEEYKHILIRLLNILFAKDYIQVRDVVYHVKEVLPDDGDGKKIIYDVYCTSKKDKDHFILEMQQVYHPLFENRATFYTAKAMATQLKKGQKYVLNPVYSIFFVDFHFKHMEERNFHDVRLMDIATHELFTDKMRMLFIHLCEAKEDWDLCENEFEKIVYIIKNMHMMDKESKAYKSGEFDEMFNASEIGGLVEEEATAYSKSRLKLEEMIEAVNYASKESFEKGIAEGMEKGLEQGRQEEKLALAKIMLSSGYSADEIKKLTGFSVDSLY